MSFLFRRTSTVPSHRGLSPPSPIFLTATHSANNSLALTRYITHWDLTYLEGTIRTMVASTKYQGALSISFTKTYTRLIVRANDSKWLDKLNPLKKDSTAAAQEGEDLSAKKPEVVKAVWPYVNVAPGKVRRECKVQTEREW